MNWVTAIAFLLLVACAAHARRPEPTRRSRTTAAASDATAQPGRGNSGGDAASGASSPQTPPLAVAGRRRPCGPGTGRRCIPLSGPRREGGGNVRDLDGRTFKAPARPILLKRRTTTSPPPPTTTLSRVAGGGEIAGPRGKWLAAGGGCSAEHSCPVGKCCVNVIIGGIAQSMCQDLARQGEYCHAGGLQPLYNRFCPCQSDSQCKPLMPPSPRGGHSSSIGVCQ